MATVHGVVLTVVSDVVNVGIVEVFGLGNLQYLLALDLVEELTLAVEQLQRVPLARVMAGGDDDATVGLEPTYGKFGSGGGGEADVDNVVAHADKGAANNAAHHFTRDACVAADDDAIVS